VRRSGFYKHSIWVGIVFLFFGIVYLASLTFVYVEGDDATSIAYHAAGRVPELQRPYSAYQCLMDSVLSLLPAREPVVRTAAMALTGFAAPLLLVLVLALAFDWAPDLVLIPRWMAAILLPLLVPEFFYLGLVYTPALLALSFAVAAHLVLRRSRSAAGAVLSVLLFAVGGAFRWDVLAYGGIILTDLLLGKPGGAAWQKRLAAALAWGAGAIAAWLTAVALTGYSPGMVLQVVRATAPRESYPGLFVMAANLQPFFTPALTLFAAIGFLVLFRYRSTLVPATVVGIALVARYVPFGVPKWMLIATPCLMACALVGLSAVLHAAYYGPFRRVCSGIVLLLILLPWIFSIRAVNDSAYGPAFEIRNFDRVTQSGLHARLAAGAGMAIPTSEGPRALGGHGWVLLAGQWRKLVRQLSGERELAIQRALDMRVPLLQDTGEGLIAAQLMGMGFHTADPWNRTAGNGLLIERRFTSSDHRTIRVLRVLQRKSLFASGDLRLLRQIAASDVVVISVLYTSILHQYYLKAPGALEELGATAAVLNLEPLIRASRTTPEVARAQDTRP